MKLKNVVIVDGVRSPFSWGGRGLFEATRLDEVAATVIRTLMSRNPKVKPTMVEDVGMGIAAPDQDLSFLGGISRLAGLPNETACFSSDRQCAAAMETAHRICFSIMTGASECGIAMGVMRSGRSLGFFGQDSDDPSITRVNRINMNAFLNKTPVQRDMAHDHDKYFSVPIPDQILDAPALMPMPQTAQNVVDMYNLTRLEMDEFAVQSHKKLLKAYEDGFYKDEVLSMEVEKPIFDENKKWVEDEKGEMVTFDRDECLRPECSIEGLSKLNPIKGIVSLTGNEVKITAGNSCPTNSGASAILLMSEEKALELGLEPLARIIGMGVAGVKGQIMGMGPVPATHRALKHAGLEMGQIDRVEFNEAFAAQVIPSLTELGLSNDICNVNGGSLGIGHPIAATGTRLILTLARELRKSNKKYGLATQCIGSGMGMSTIIEAID